ncbi:MAG TPA: nuclear transport factor 2 family protein [Candidatus Elarobacter sp.]|nr:nuclear transport factor 2 family protein [Candidatus Elarobacter sp.]
MSANVAQVQAAYGDFGRGDIVSLLNRCTDDIAWYTPGEGTAIPYAGRLNGKDAVAGFFQKLGSTVEFQDFQPREFIAQDDVVVCLGTWDATVRATGIRHHGEFAMVFRLRDGKIADFKEYSDSRLLADAFAGKR